MYRPEIDGLRTIAVVPVVLFHAGLPWLPGGFVGVDVFFVISGYLITRILLQDIEQDRFSILTFYERRIRRIFPALFAVLAVSTVLASQLLLWDEFNEYARSMAFSTLFLANHHFMGDVGYFAGAAEVKPLLHMWSLAVEEQFYILFPLYLFWLCKYARAALVPVSLVLLLASLLLCLWWTSHDANTAFYIAPTRAWELLAGSVLAMAPMRAFLKSPALCNAIGVAGFGAIAWAMIAIDKTTPFPGVAAMLPVLGASAIIYSSTHHRGWIGAFLSTAPMRGVGLISYSLYLWHWPLIVFYRFWRIEHPAPWEMALVVVASVVMATLSWRFVEHPFRAKTLLPTRKKTLGAGIATLAIFTIVGGVIDLKDGFKTSYPPKVNATMQAAFEPWDRQRCEPLLAEVVGFDVQACPLGSSALEDASFAIWGDSHGGMMLPAFDTVVDQAGRGGMFTGYQGCPPLLGVNRRLEEYTICADAQRAVFQDLTQRDAITDVILISRWSRYALGTSYGSRPPNSIYIADESSEGFSLKENPAAFERGLYRSLEALKAAGKRVHILSAIPETEFNIPRQTARSLWYNRDVDLRPSVEDYQSRNAFVHGLFEKAHDEGLIETLLTVEQTLCPEGFCKVMHNGAPGYRDDNHLSIEAARALAPLVAQFLDAPS